MERGERGPQGDKGERGERGRDTWDGYRELVLHELRRLSETVNNMDKQNREDHARVVSQLSEINGEVSALKVKAGFYGALAGLGSGVMIFMASLFGRFHQ